MLIHDYKILMIQSGFLYQQNAKFTTGNNYARKPPRPLPKVPPRPPPIPPRPPEKPPRPPENPPRPPEKPPLPPRKPPREAPPRLAPGAPSIFFTGGFGRNRSRGREEDEGIEVWVQEQRTCE